jgi:quercetin dioxygenase-like cupin family protein
MTHPARLTFVLTLGLAVAFSITAQETPSKAIRFDEASIAWKPAPAGLPTGSEVAVLEGDPQGSGIFTMRVRIPAGTVLAPHWHPRDERVTVISGSVELGFGAVADRTSVTRLGAGSFYINPPREMHYVFFPEDTVLQMTGLGPWRIETTDLSAPAVVSTARVRIVDLKPAAGASLASTDTITAAVEYEIDGFRPATFLLSLQFDTNTPGKTIGGTLSVVSSGDEPTAPPERKTLTAKSGRAEVSASLRYILLNDEVRRPLRMRVYVQEIKSPTTSRVVATSEPVDFAQ